MAIVVHPDRIMTVDWLPELRRLTAEGWAERLHSSAAETSSELDDRSLRAMRGPSRGPNEATLNEVIGWMSEQLTPLTGRLSANQVAVISHVGGRRKLLRGIRVVPVGVISWLPVSAALTRVGRDVRPVTIAVSGRLHAVAIRQAQRAVSPHIIAVTNPTVKADSDEGNYPNLPAAAEEGRELAANHQAQHFTGAAADHAVLNWLEQHPWWAVHLSVHGNVDPNNPQNSQLMLADGPVRLRDITAKRMNTRLVFLAACWLARPGEQLPDESIAFPTALLQAGSAGVVAPLWPVDDTTTKQIVGNFYRGWLTEGRTAAQALALALFEARREHPTTWAAFTLSGA